MTERPETQDGLLVALVGAGLGIATGLALSRAGGLSSIVLIGAVAVVGLTPLVVSLGRMALPAWVVLTGVAYPFLRYPADGPVVTFDRLFLGALLVSFAIAYVRHAQSRESVWLQRSFLVLAAVFFLSAVSTGSQSSLAIWVDAFLLPAIAFWCAREAAADRRQLLTIAGALAIAGATIATLGLAQRFGGIDIAPLLGSAERFDTAIGQVRISGPFPAPEPFALVLLSCLAATLFWIRSRGPAALLPGGLAVTLQLAAIFFTYFRAAWLGAVLILLIALVGGRRSWSGRVAAVAVAIGGLLIVSAAASSNDAVQTRLHNQQNVSGRFATYERGLELFERHPVSGVGFQRFEIAVREIPQISVQGVRAIPQAHSSIVSTLAEQGLLGFVPLLATVLSLALVLRALWLRARDRIDKGLAIYAVGAALAYLVMSATLTMIYYGPSNVMFALLVGLACGRLDALRRPTR